MKTHDFRGSRGWGHDYVWSPDPGSGGRTGTLSGWITPRPVVGDVIIIESPHSPDGGARYRVVEVKWPGNVVDMFFARVEWVKWAFRGRQAVGPWEEVASREEEP
jgi:hypothetical protein